MTRGHAIGREPRKSYAQKHTHTHSQVHAQAHTQVRKYFSALNAVTPRTAVHAGVASGRLLVRFGWEGRRLVGSLAVAQHVRVTTRVTTPWRILDPIAWPIAWRSNVPESRRVLLPLVKHNFISVNSIRNSLRYLYRITRLVTETTA